MNVKNCTKCGKIFNYVMGPTVCPECKKSLEEKFKEARVFIRKNPDANMSDVAQACNTDIKQIRQWIREERLSFSKDSAIGIDCEMCGKTIKTGRYCADCKKEVTHNLNSAYRKEPQVEENAYAKKDRDSKMRFLNKDRI